MATTRTIETSETRWQAGDTVIAHGGGHVVRVVAVVVAERVMEQGERQPRPRGRPLR